MLEDRVPHGAREAQALDALRRPLGADLAAGNSPNFLGIALKEFLEQTPPEPIDHPILEAVDSTGPSKTRDRPPHSLSLSVPAAESDAQYRVYWRQRIIEIFPVIEDARLPGHPDRFVTKHVFEELAYLCILREEAMRPDVEAVALERNGAGQTADMSSRSNTLTDAP